MKRKYIALENVLSVLDSGCLDEISISDYEYLCESIEEEAEYIALPYGWNNARDSPPKKDGAYIVYAPTYKGGSSSGKENYDGIMFSMFKNGKWSIEHGYYRRPGCVVCWLPLPFLPEE